MRQLTDISKIYIIFASLALCLGAMSYFVRTQPTNFLSSSFDEPQENELLSEYTTSTSQRKNRFRKAKLSKFSNSYAYSEDDYEEEHLEPGQHSTNPNDAVAIDSKQKSKKKKNSKKKRKKKKVAKKDNKKKKDNTKKRELSEEDFDEDYDGNYDEYDTNMYALAANQNQNQANNLNPNKKEHEEEKEENLDTFEYWEEPIFFSDEPLPAVNKLISSYHGKKVSNGIFYEVVGEMTVHEKAELRTWGVYALGETPSAKSFSLLTFAKYNQNETEESIRNTATLHLSSYAGTTNISHVMASLSPSNEAGREYVNIEAMKVTSKNASYLGETPLDKDGKPISINAEVLESNLRRAATMIEDTHLKSTNPQVKAQAEQTYADIGKNIAL